MRMQCGTKASVVGCALAMLAGTSVSLAELPAAFDRVPADAPLAFVVRSLEEFKRDADLFVKDLGLPLPEGEQNPLAMAEMMLGKKGVNAKGSLAVVFTKIEAPAEGGMVEAKEPEGVALVPITSFADFIASFGGQGSGVVELKMGEGEEIVLVKDIGGGYAAMTDKREVLDAFKGEGGQKAAHAKRLGKVGDRIANASDMVLVANIDALRPQLEKGVAGMDQQMGMLAAMAGGNPGLESNAKIGQMLAKNFVRDAQVAVLGFEVDGEAVSIDLGTQFKDKSELAGLFDFAGATSTLIGKLPAQQFLFAFAADTSTPGMKRLISNAAKLQEEFAPKGADGKPAAQGPNVMSMWTRSIEEMDGFAMGMGAADLGAGLFVNTSSFTATKNPGALLAATKKMYTDLNGQKADGITYKTSYKDGYTTVGGVKADQWTMGMDIDPDNQMAMQMQMMQNFLYGPEGQMTGLVAPAQGGLAMTMSTNTELLESAIGATKGGGGLGNDDLLKMVQSKLPASRSVEGYIGVRSIMDVGMSFAQMMGAAPEITLPEKIAPIGFGATTNEGGFSARIVVPMDVIKTMKNVVEQMEKAQGQGEEPMQGEPEEGKGPKF